MEPEDSPMAEMFTLFPQESAVVMQRGIELGIICSSVLVVHCVGIVAQYWASDWYQDIVLRVFCVVRIVCAMPRPYFWFRNRKLFVEARYQPTPQMVTQRLLDIYAHPFSVERFLLLFYYAWLGVITVVVCIMRVAVEENSGFTKALWRHCLYNFVSIVLHRVGCVVLFYCLMRSDFNRGIPPDILEKYTKRFPFQGASERLASGDMECAICFGPYIDGEEIRRLACKHHFHQRCVDVWLLGHQNRCPLCLALVGPKFLKRASLPGHHAD